jgi:hypothetical protein
MIRPFASGARLPRCKMGWTPTNCSTICAATGPIYLHDKLTAATVLIAAINKGQQVMSCYSKVIQATGLNSDSQGSGNALGGIWLLLSALDHFDTADDVLPNAASEILRRLDTWKEGRFMRESVKPFLTSLADKLARS